MLNSPLLCLVTRGNPLKETLWACEAVPCWASVLFRAMEMPVWIHCPSYTRDCSNSSIANNDQFTSSSTSSGFWTHSPSLNRNGSMLAMSFRLVSLSSIRGWGKAWNLFLAGWTLAHLLASPAIAIFLCSWLIHEEDSIDLAHVMFSRGIVGEGLLGDSWLQHVAAEWVKCCGFSSSKEEAAGETPGLAEFETAAAAGWPRRNLLIPKKTCWIATWKILKYGSAVHFGFFWGGVWDHGQILLIGGFDVFVVCYLDWHFPLDALKVVREDGMGSTTRSQFRFWDQVRIASLYKRLVKVPCVSI